MFPFLTSAIALSNLFAFFFANSAELHLIMAQRTKKVLGLVPRWKGASHRIVRGEELFELENAMAGSSHKARQLPECANMSPKTAWLLSVQFEKSALEYTLSAQCDWQFYF